MDPEVQRKLHRLEENLGAVDVQLTAMDLQAIAEGASTIHAEGARYSEGGMRMIDR